jgi:type II secretory ATPase GspE/PulE/Tfp pilus assembly ATPase PilB-like protein
LLSFVRDARIVRVQVAAAIAPVPLRFDQFRSLTITEPLRPDAAVATPAHPVSGFESPPRRPYIVQLKAGGSLSGQTVGHVELDYDLFLFPPVGGNDGVLRMFVPREVCRRYELGAVIDALQPDRFAPPQSSPHAQGAGEKSAETLAQQPIVSAEQLLKALDVHGRMPGMRVGQTLVEIGLVRPEQVAAALEAQKSDRNASLGELLVRQNAISRADLRAALARTMGYPLVDLARFAPQVEALHRIPARVALRLHALPLAVRNASLVVAIDDLTRWSALDELESVARMKIIPALSDGADIDLAVRKAYARDAVDVAGRVAAAISVSKGRDLEAHAASTAAASVRPAAAEPTQARRQPQAEPDDSALVHLVDKMIVQAHSDGASGIHIECSPGDEKVRIRFRKDGQLRPYQELPHTCGDALVARIKTMGELDIAERRKPQDGKIDFARLSPRHTLEPRLQLRVATIPTGNGLEDVVLRLLAGARPLPLTGLGLSPDNLVRLKAAIERPHGIVLCVGPSGAGKTTTLHSALGHINVPERRIWTAEDPVEISQAGLRQVQVDPDGDWTFVQALRAFLRADPDVIMVGELRDQDTARMVIDAALAGYLMLSTLRSHTAPDAVTRLLDMGNDPFNLADALLAVLAQRLVRRLCTQCRVGQPASAAQIDELLSDYRQIMPSESDSQPPASDLVLSGWTARFAHGGRLMAYASTGCAQCAGTGRSGWLALHELMVIDPAQRRLIQTRATAIRLQDCAMRNGMRTLRQDGIEKVLQGMTTIDEVRAATSSRADVHQPHSRA